VTPERIYADTNLFLRYLTNDVPDQAGAVEKLLHRAAAGEVVLAVHSLVMAEIVWTLESFYGLTRESVKDKVLAILNTPGLEVADGDLILQAIAWYADRNVDFANVDFIDAFAVAWMLAQGVTRAMASHRKHFARLGHRGSGAVNAGAAMRPGESMEVGTLRLHMPTRSSLLDRLCRHPDGSDVSRYVRYHHRAGTHDGPLADSNSLYRSAVDAQLATLAHRHASPNVHARGNGDEALDHRIVPYGAGLVDKHVRAYAHVRI